MSANLPCPGPVALERLLLGEMPAEEMAALERHVAACLRCLEVLRGLRAEDNLVEAVRAGGKAVGILRAEVDPQLIDRLYGLPSSVFPTAALSQDTALACSARDGVEELSGLLEPPLEADELGRFGSYGILRCLGSGGMGVVFAARRAHPRRVVALKMILAGPRGGAAHFHSETEVVARLRHPNIVHLYEAGEHGGRAYYTMEYLDGGNLAQRLAKAPLAPRAAAELAQVLARAIHFAHGCGVVHRDLKPANVLLGADGTPKVGDFGLAKLLDDAARENAAGVRTKTGAIVGTPDYMAPEQAEGRKDVGPSCDVYGLGAVLYECLTGRPPFRAATVLETLEQVRSQEPVRPGNLQPGLPRDLQTICLKCLHKDPARRYASAAALADDLGRFLRREPIHARPIPLQERLMKWVWRHPAPAALAAVSVLFTAALVVGVLLHNAGLRAAIKRAEDGETRARQEGSRADANYRSARDALDRMLRRLERPQVGEAPQLKELQRDQREDALAFYQGVLAGSDDPDPQVQLDAAYAYQWVANLQSRLDRGADAVPNYGRAIELVEGLPPKLRDLVETQSLLAACYGDRGQIKVQVHLSGGEQDLDKALDVNQRLARAEPDDPERQEDLAKTEHQMGQVDASANRLDDAARHYTHAAALRAVLVHDHPGNEVYQTALAEDYVNLGPVYGAMGRSAEGNAVYEKAEGLLRSLVGRHPDDIRSTLALSALVTNRGLDRAETGAPANALPLLTEAVELAEPVLRREPTLAAALRQAFYAHGARAQTYDRLGRWAEAGRDWQRVLELDERPERWVNQIYAALAWARAGDHSRAAGEAKDLPENAAVTEWGRYMTAAVYAHCVEAARSDERLSPASRAALAERYAAEAVALLSKLREQGYFNNAGNAEWLRTDEELNALRVRPDFQKLLTHGASP
jgi:eukaryotic-like serine/threonine-protein kinase